MQRLLRIGISLGRSETVKFATRTLSTTEVHIGRVARYFRFRIGLFNAKVTQHLNNHFNPQRITVLQTTVALASWLRILLSQTAQGIEELVIKNRRKYSGPEAGKTENTVKTRYKQIHYQYPRSRLYRLTKPQKGQRSKLKK